MCCKMLSPSVCEDDEATRRPFFPICIAPNKQESTMSATSKKKAIKAATDKLPKSPPAVSTTPTITEVPADEADVFRDTFMLNLDSKDPDPEKRPLVLYLKQKNAKHGKGWLRKALYPGTSGPHSNSKMVLLLSSSVIGTNSSTKIVAYACGISEETLENQWDAALSALR
jgi:hypothetical protein